MELESFDQAERSFRWALFLQSLVCNEVLRCILRALNFTILCTETVPIDYNPNIVVFADELNNFVDHIFRCRFTVSGLFGIDSIQLALLSLLIVFNVDL